MVLRRRASRARAPLLIRTVHGMETDSPFPHTPTDVIPNFSNDNISNRLIYGHLSRAFRRRTEKEGERVSLTWSGLIWLCLRITGGRRNLVIGHISIPIVQLGKIFMSAITRGGGGHDSNSAWYLFRTTTDLGQNALFHNFVIQIALIQSN